jgi:hypothetical protein
MIARSATRTCEKRYSFLRVALLVLARCATRSCEKRYSYLREALLVLARSATRSCEKRNNRLRRLFPEFAAQTPAGVGGAELPAAPVIPGVCGANSSRCWWGGITGCAGYSRSLRRKLQPVLAGRNYRLRRLFSEFAAQTPAVEQGGAGLEICLYFWQDFIQFTV